ncbi:MAG: hypothetical protein EOP82_02125 [Variovorax sp.]|nr:MAG: hypothetical protein EOP82_02125 [Variovorax sp.]
MSENSDTIAAAILAALLEAHDDKVGLSVARLRKQLGFSLVMRTLSALIDANLMELTRLHDQNIGAGLTEAGFGLARRHQGPRIEALRKTVP